MCFVLYDIGASTINPQANSKTRSERVRSCQRERRAANETSATLVYIYTQTIHFCITVRGERCGRWKSLKESSRTLQLAGNNPPALFSLNRKEPNGSSIQSGVGHLELQNNQTKPISLRANTPQESNSGPMCEEAPLWKVAGDFQLECNWRRLTPQSLMHTWT